MIGDISGNLEESIESFKVITEQSLIGILIIQDGLFKYYNERVVNGLGYSAEEIKNWAPYEFSKTIHPDDREFVMEQARKKQAGETDVVNMYQYRAIKRNGEVEWLEVFAKTINYGGRPADLVMSFNITDKINAEQKVKESEEKFRTIAEQSLIGIAILQDGLFKYVNKKYTELSGYSAEEIKSWAPNEFIKVVYPEDREFVMEQARKKQAGDPDIVTQYQCRALTKDGKVGWRIIFGKTIDYGGRPADLVMSYDITERIIAQQKLKESEENFRNIAEQSLIGIVIIQDGLFKYFNDRFSKMDGYSAEEIKNWAPYEFAKLFHPEDREFVMEQARKKQAGDPDVVSQYQCRVITKDGKVGWRKIFGKTINYGGRPADLVMSYDITDKIIAQQMLKESEDKFRTIAEQSQIGIGILQDGLPKYFNKRFCELNGYTAEEIKSWAPNEFVKIVHPKDREFVMEQIRKKQAGELDGANQYQIKVITKDGDIGWREILGKTINYGGRPADLVMSHDITDKVVAEKNLKKSKEKYQYAFNQSEFYKDLFVHDINNTLQSLLSSIQLIDLEIEELEKKEGIKQYIDVIYRQINRGVNLISNVRKLSQLESHEISSEIIDVFQVLNQSIELLRNAFQERKINIEIDTCSDKLSIRGNGLLHDVFENILINSVKYNNNKIVEIMIKVSEVDQEDNIYYRLEFMDNGIGIEDSRKENALSRVDTHSKTTYGMGLGLSLVKKIIENYKGKIWIEDRIKGDFSKGTNIILLIPRGD